MMYSVVILVALSACASAQTFGQLKSCFKVAHDTCNTGCQASSNASQTFLDKMKACADAERNVTVSAVSSCATAAGVIIDDSTPCWQPDDTWTETAAITVNPKATPYPALKAYHECMFVCIMDVDCLKSCVAAAPEGKAALSACHRTAEQSAKPAFIACMKAATST